MKIIVYSANIGGYDRFKTPIKYDPNVRYILFTDNKYFNSEIWEICHVDFLKSEFNNRKKSRFLKLNPHVVLPNHDFSIWVDHSFTLETHNVEKILTENNFFNKKIMMYKHDIRKCTFKESEEVIKQNLELPNIVNSQMFKYRQENFPKDFGLYSTGFMIRANEEKINKFNEDWWNEVNNYSQRDQLSQSYCVWKNGINVSNFLHGANVYNNPYLSSKIRHEIKFKL